MILKYGVDSAGDLVYIGETTLPGKVFCFYCGGEIVAQKGRLMVEDHFTHNGDTCDPSNRDGFAVDLPLYDQFNLNLSDEERQLLKWFADAGNFNKPNLSWQRATRTRDQLVTKGLIANREGQYQLTKQGCIPSGELPLRVFADEQHRLIRERHEDLEQAVTSTENVFERDLAIADLRLFRAQWKRALSATLCLLEVIHQDGRLYKIGVTWQPVGAYITKIRDELEHLLDNIQIRPVQILANQGLIGEYIMLRYASQQQFSTSLSLSGYFAFESLVDVVDELIALGDREPDELERQLLGGKTSVFGFDEDRIALTVYDARRGEYQRHVRLKKYQITCKQCGQFKTLWRYPGQPPTLCSAACELDYKRDRDRDKTRERVRRYRARKSLEKRQKAITR